MCHARVEVVNAICGRAVDDAGAVICGGVVGQIHRRGACKARVDVCEWMVKFDEIEFLADCRSDNFAAELPAF